jgi:uncharacterized protein YigE (DUF2233 family)
MVETRTRRSPSPAADDNGAQHHRHRAQETMNQSSGWRQWMVGFATVLAAQVTLPAHAQWTVSSTAPPTSLGSGAAFVKKKLAGPVQADLKLVFFSASQCSLRVVSQPTLAGAGSLGEAMRTAGALAGCNGAYFNPQFAPLGLEVASGVRTGKLERSSLLGGVLVVRKGKPMMLWRDEFVEQSGITDLVQAGPRLVNGGQPVKGLEATKRRARTFVLTDCAGQWAIGLSSHVSLRELSDLLATKGIITECEVERALNLDGGSSSGLWFRGADGKEEYDREFATVRNFLAVVPKSR